MNSKYFLFYFIASILFVGCSTYPKEVREELKKMGENDEKYRWILTTIRKSNKNSHNLDSIINYPEAYKKRYLKRNNIYLTQDAISSVWERQDNLDSLNYIRLISIINEYGFPSRKDAGFFRYFDVSVMVLHYLKHEEELNPILKQACLEGKMLARDYAYFYDRCCLVNNREILYATSNLHPSKCITNLEKTNKARVEIGLKPLKQRENCR